ncbi:hypothetical protein KM043_018813 [Ampulex compressa]|nr:hypothetical protein KM043_018813 [Ampulex compressa]
MANVEIDNTLQKVNSEEETLNQTIVERTGRAPKHLKITENENEEEVEESENHGKENEEESTDESGNESDVGESFRRKHKRRGKEIIKFTIKDVDDSIPYFTGDNKLPIKKWIEDFEELSNLLDWNDLQKLLYGKRMLQGSAKQFITYEKNITSWSILKRKLLREFKSEVNSVVIHEQLRKRKRLASESARKCVGAMQEIASQGNVEENALIEHNIKGIPDFESNKTMLYEATYIIQTKAKNVCIRSQKREASGIQKVRRKTAR